MIIIDGLDFLLDTFTWSFSRLNSFYHCPFEWKCVYIDCLDKEASALAEYGTLMHQTLEKYAKGELSIFELNDYYNNNFESVIQHDFPYNKYVDLRESYYNKGLEYLNNIDLDFDKYEILGVEKKVEFEIAGKPFVGFIDLLLRDRTNGEIIIVDHKSASIKILKNGNISKTDQEHFLEFKRQLYLYSLPILKEYGRVDKLKWNLFKEQKWIEIPYSQEECDESLKWARDTIKLIEETKEFLPNTDSFYCYNLCSQRTNACPFKPQFLSKRECNPEQDYVANDINWEKNL